MTGVRPQLVMVAGLAGLVVAVFVGVGRTGGAVALAVAAGMVFLVGLAAWSGSDRAGS